MKTIIAPTDFSQVSENACLYAANLAMHINAELLLLHTVELPVTVTEFPLPADSFNEMIAEKELDALKNKLNDATNNKILIHTKNILGSVELEIRELCKESEPFAVVMATNSYSYIDRLLFGSITAHTAKHLRYPVIVVPANAIYQPVKKIGLASDLKDIYEIPAQEIEMITKTFNAELEIFYAARNEKAINRNTVGSLLLDHRLLDLNPKFYFIENDDILKGVTSMAKEHEIDMLLIIPKKHGPLHKSQTKDFILYADIPLMAIHENDYNNNKQ